MGVAIAVVLLVVLTAVVLVSASKRRDRSAAGLSRETRKRDRANPVLAGQSSSAPTAAPLASMKIGAMWSPSSRPRSSHSWLPTQWP